MPLQVVTGWRWWNRLEADTAARGKQVLRVNVDETNISRSYHNKKGLVLTRRCPARPMLLPGDAVTRGSFSHVAFICDNTEIQPLLPQLILGNSRVLRKQDLDVLQPSLPDNVYLIRAKSSWLDAATFVAALKWLARALTPFKHTHDILLLMDCCYVHLHRDVLRAARKADIKVCFVPNKTTWLLQPCDTHLFRRYKAYLRRAYQAVQLRTASQDVPAVDLLSILIEIIRHVLQGIPWAKAFADNGYTLHQHNTCHRIRHLLPDLVVPTENDSALCFADMCAVLPRGREYSKKLLWPETVQDDQARIGPELLEGVQPKPSLLQATLNSEHEASIGSAFDHPDELCADSVDSWYSRLRPRHNRSAASSSTAPKPEQPSVPASLASSATLQCPSSSSADPMPVGSEWPLGPPRARPLLLPRPQRPPASLP